MATATNKNAREALWSKIKDVRIAMLTTADAEGRLHARPMATQSADDFDGTLWFFTRADSGKVAEIRNRGQVNLAYAEPNDRLYVSVAGTAALVRDPDEIAARWREAMRTWFPNGPDDPELALLKIDVESAEYWDAPSGAMVMLYDYVMGKPPQPSENRRIELE